MRMPKSEYKYNTFCGAACYICGDTTKAHFKRGRKYGCESPVCAVCSVRGDKIMRKENLSESSNAVLTSIWAKFLKIFSL